MDGDVEHTLPVIVDLVVRDGFARAIEQLMTPFGWDCAGGTPLTEPDEFLGGARIDQASPALVHHAAIYVIDRDMRAEAGVRGRRPRVRRVWRRDADPRGSPRGRRDARDLGAPRDSRRPSATACARAAQRFDADLTSP
jgi:hypothetical protein